MTPPTRAEIEGDIEFYLGHGDEGVRDLAVTALALLSENKRLTSLAKHERDNRGEQTKNKRVTHDVLTGMLRTAEAQHASTLKLVSAYRSRANAAEARIAALEAVANSHMAALRAQAQDAANRVKQAEYIRDSTLSEPQEGEGGPRTAFSADATPEEVDAWIATRDRPTSPPAEPTR